MNDAFAVLSDPHVQEAFENLDSFDQLAYASRLKWLKTAHKHQKPPQGDWFTIQLVLAGRGAGQTRLASEQIWWWAWTQPKTRWLVIAPTSSDIRGTCYEGESGLMNVIPLFLIADYNKSISQITLVNGSIIGGIPASEPSRLRGPQWHGCWADELAAFDYLEEAWQQIMFSVRLGQKTRIIATTTPRPKDLIV